MMTKLCGFRRRMGFTGGDYGEARKFFRWEIELVPQYIIPAALKPAGSRAD